MAVDLSNSLIGARTRHMKEIGELTIKTNCRSCANKCCSQPYDWVFLTAREIERLEAASGSSADQFVSLKKNPKTGQVFRTLNLPCPFLNVKTGDCQVYESRPLVCRLYPFYLEPLTGHATLMPGQCGDNLHVLADPSEPGTWRLHDFEDSARQWLAELWNEASTEE